MLPDRWDDTVARTLEPEELLRYRSNLLGADLRITNFGGGNTSAKLSASDPVTGEPVAVLWVKGSGGDLGSIRRDGFATLYQSKLLALERRYRGLAHEDEMAEALRHCVFAANPRPASIDTPLHALLPFAHVDHVHPDAVIALATTPGGEALVREVFAGEVGWLAWLRPGFELGLRLRALVAQQPQLRGAVLEGHGLVSWGDTARACYETTLELVRRAEELVAERARRRPAFGGPRIAARAAEERRAIATRLAPRLRAALGGERARVGHFVDDAETLEFVCAADVKALADAGTSCPDHFLRTKIHPLVLPEDPDDAIAQAPALVAAYRAEYTAYYERCRRPESPPLRDPAPVISLMPGVGLFTFAASKATARLAAEFYGNAIRVMRGAVALGGYAPLPEHEAFAVEYWPLEEAKLRGQPAAKHLAGRVALVTGAAGGIGRAIARRLLADDACVVLLDVAAERLARTHAELAAEFGDDAVRAVACDVTSEAAVAGAFAAAAREYGGVDIVVSNAGIASAAAIEDTTLALWERNQAVLVTGYFLVAREAARLLKAQRLGGAIVFVASKNALVASPLAAAYNAAKAAELQLARTLAVELAPQKIRVNVVNPDAVIQGSEIWSGSWRRERAAAHGISEDALVAHYRERSLLRESVLPEDVAEAVAFFASARSAKSTGNILNVDGGNAAAFPR
jgi:rhamnulose-1-phosphate aldolase/alcohol dehydrogenase